MCEVSSTVAGCSATAPAQHAVDAVQPVQGQLAQLKLLALEPEAAMAIGWAESCPVAPGWSAPPDFLARFQHH